jgi:hypothetical protein
MEEDAMSYSSVNSNALPLALMGDNVRSSYRYHKGKKPGAVGNVGHHTRADLRVYIWYPLLDAMRRFVVEPFDGPWTQGDEA